MSRSKKGAKNCGYDYWGKRALSGDCGYGPEVKKQTKKKERAKLKEDLNEGKELPSKESFGGNS